MNQDTQISFELPAVAGKKLSVGFDGGMLSSNGGTLLLRGVERRLGLAARLAACVTDRRNPERIEHSVEEMLRLRMFAIAAGHEDGNDFATLRHDPIFKMAVGRAPESGDALCSQPTLSRLENAPSRIELARMTQALLDQFCDSLAPATKSIVLDIDDTLDVTHGRQQLSLFNAHHDEYCFLPIHIYEGTSGKPVAMILRSGKVPAGVEVRTVLKHVIARIRRKRPKLAILVRGDSHYGRQEAMTWCEANGIDYIFGLATNAILTEKSRAMADALTAWRATSRETKSRTWCELRYGAKSWGIERRVIARIEETDMGRDIRYIVTSLPGGAEHLYEKVYCARGQAENFIKDHKTHLASDRTSCRDPRANQFRLILHTAAYWLMHTLRAAAPKRSAIARLEFATLRLRLLKIAARVIEGAARIRVWLPTACPDAAMFRHLARRFATAGP